MDSLNSALRRYAESFGEPGREQFRRMLRLCRAAFALRLLDKLSPSSPRASQTRCRKAGASESRGGGLSPPGIAFTLHCRPGQAFGEFCARVGRSKSLVKWAAVLKNLARAKAALAAKRADRAAKELDCARPPPPGGNGWLV